MFGSENTNQIYSIFQQASQGYQSCQNYFKNNREKIEQATPIIQKVSLYAIALLSLYLWTNPTLLSGIAGFILSDKVHFALEKIQSILQKAQSTPLGLKHDWSQLNLEEKKHLAFAAVVIVAIAMVYIPFSSTSIPIGLYTGTKLREHGEFLFKKE